MRFAVLLPPLAAAETVTVVVWVTGAVVTVKVPLVLPAVTMKLLGMEAIAELPAVTVRVTVVSVATAIPKVTFPTEVWPPVTELGVKVNAVGTFAFTVSVPVLLPPFAVPLI